MAVPFIPPLAATAGFAKAISSSSAPTANGASSAPSTSGFNAGLGAEHASSDIPASTKAESSGFVSPGMASSPIVAALPSASSGVHSEGLTRAELNAKKAEVITGHKLDELTPREQAAAQLGVVGALPGASGAGGGLPASVPPKTLAVGEEPSLFGEANKLFHKATQAAYNAVPPSVIQKLEGGNSPTASPTARRASTLFEQAKHVLGVESVHPGGPSDTPVKSTTTIPAGTTVVVGTSVPTNTTALGQTPVAGPTHTATLVPTPTSASLVDQASTVGKDVGRRASAVIEQAKHLLGVDEVFPGGVSAGHVNKGKESEMAHTRRPSVADQAKGVADQAKGIFNNVIGAVKAEFATEGGAPAVYGGLGLASAGIVGATAVGAAKSKPSQEIDGAKVGEKSDGVGALPGAIEETAVAAPPDVKANPDPLGEGVGSIAPQSWHTAPTDAAPAAGSSDLAPPLGEFIGATPAVAETTKLPTAIDSKPIADVLVAADPAEKAFPTGTPALPLNAADPSASTDAIIHGNAGHGVTGAGIGLDADKTTHVSSAPSLTKSSAPGHVDNGVGSTANGTSDKTTPNSEPHASVPEKFAAVGHGTVAEPGTSKPAKAAEETESSASKHSRQGSSSSNGKKGGFMSKVHKIKAKLTHES